MAANLPLTPISTPPPNFRFVLLKERNMLLTLRQEAKRANREMPSPERLRKVSS